MRYIKYFLCGMVWLSALLYGQNAEGFSSDPYKELYHLQRKVESLEKRLEEWKKKENAIEQAKKELKRKKATSEHELAEKKKELVQKEEKWKGQEATLHDEIERLRAQHETDSATMANLRSDLEKLKKFRIEWLAQLVGSVEERWLKKAYSAVDLKELEADSAQYKKYASEDERVNEAYEKLCKYLADYRLYTAGVNAVHSRYDKTVVDGLAPQIENLWGRATDEQKAKELKLLYWQLNNYRETVQIFQDVIKEIEGIVIDTEMPDHKSAWPLVKEMLGKQKENGNIPALREIPWLSEQYDKYEEDLGKNCVKPSVVRNEIMGFTF